MPTIATQPSLRNTQAVGALLLHQFARQRFLEAGVDDRLIPEVENEENIDHLTDSLLQEDNNYADILAADISDSSRVSTLVDESNSEQSSILTSSTVQNSSQNGIDFNHSGERDQYHSIVESVTSNGGAGGGGGDSTIYHSMSAGHRVAPGSERLQSTPIVASYGRELRRIAEEFEKSPMRQAIKERANNVRLSDINKETFIVMLEELFQGGITSERVVTLFFFCTDLALRAASFAQELVVKLMGWSFSYIIETVCRIVHELGGWDTVLFRQLPSLLITCCAFLGVCLLTICLRKSLRAPEV